MNAALAAAAFLFFVPKLKEIRNVEPITKQKLLAEMVMAMPKAAFRDLFFPFLAITRMKRKNGWKRQFTQRSSDFSGA